MGKTVIKTALSDYPITAGLKTGSLAAPGMHLEFEPVNPVTNAFRPMIREQTFDICEMAIVAYLQARAHGKPIWLLPAVLLARFQHRCIVFNSAFNKTLRPEDLKGRVVGVRAFSQTTGAWVRGILANDYGVDLDGIKWITYEDAHVAEYSDPPGTERAQKGKKPGEMLQNGEIDAAILGNDLPKDDRLLSVIPNPAADAKAWYARHGIIPINHMVVVSERMLAENLDAVTAFFGLLEESKRRGNGSSEMGVDMNPLGLTAMRSSLQTIINYSLQQGLIPRHLSVDELFHDSTRELGL